MSKNSESYSEKMASQNKRINHPISEVRRIALDWSYEMARIGFKSCTANIASFQPDSEIIRKMTQWAKGQIEEGCCNNREEDIKGKTFKAVKEMKQATKCEEVNNMLNDAEEYFSPAPVVVAEVKEVNFDQIRKAQMDKVSPKIKENMTSGTVVEYRYTKDGKEIFVSDHKLVSKPGLDGSKAFFDNDHYICQGPIRVKTFTITETESEA